MAKRQVEGFDVRSKRTGELYDMWVEPKYRDRRRFVRLFQDAKQRLLMENPQFRGETLRVLAYLETVTDWKNKLPAPKEVANRLSLHEKSAYRAFAQLVEAGAILRIDDTYYLHPELCWKGNEAQLEEAYRTIFAFLRTGSITPALSGVREVRAGYRAREG